MRRSQSATARPRVAKRPNEASLFAALRAGEPDRAGARSLI